MVLYAPDPVGLLPPDSSSLLPSVVPRPAMVGICGCGEPEDDSLWMQVRRDRHMVIWEPDPNAPRSSIEATYRFDAVQYLEAVDEGHRLTIGWETRPRLLARELRRQRDSLFGFYGLRLLTVRSWPGVNHLMIEVAGTDGIQWYKVLRPCSISAIVRPTVLVRGGSEGKPVDDRGADWRLEEQDRHRHHKRIGLRSARVRGGRPRGMCRSGSSEDRRTLCASQRRLLVPTFATGAVYGSVHEESPENK